MNVVWFKRDLRLTDHEPLYWVCQQGKPIYLIYIFEPDLVNDDHYSVRHWQFVYQSLREMQEALKSHQLLIHIFYANALEVLDHLLQHHVIESIVSYEETGLDVTFQRDKAVQTWCHQHQINWIQFQTNAVIRKLPNRDTWDYAWKKVMKAPLVNPQLNTVRMADSIEEFGKTLPKEWQDTQNIFQKGGPQQAKSILKDFLEERGKAYHFNLSKPENSRQTCSRLSPYLAWGNISLREVYQIVLGDWNRPGWRKPLQALISRLHWHCHFIQKFENESDMEFRAINKGYSRFPYRKDVHVERHLQAWKTGHTGFPMVDASMRCVNQTGYLNFRMRAMLVSFLCHHLLIDWRLGVKHLASVFLDFEPGIHYTQFQMQASVTGINTIRMYNPIKQGLDHDPKAEFIAKWCPELAVLPVELRHEPWRVTPLDAVLYQFKLAVDYPEPIIDLEAAGKWSRELLWSWRKKPSVKKEADRILARHVKKRVSQ